MDDKWKRALIKRLPATRGSHIKKNTIITLLCKESTREHPPEECTHCALREVALSRGTRGGWFLILGSVFAPRPTFRHRVERPRPACWAGGILAGSNWIKLNDSIHAYRQPVPLVRGAASIKLFISFMTRALAFLLCTARAEARWLCVQTVLIALWIVFR